MNCAIEEEVQAKGIENIVNKITEARHQWLMPVILVTWEIEVGGNQDLRPAQANTS
jgi:hypothetical protein